MGVLPTAGLLWTVGAGSLRGVDAAAGSAAAGGAVDDGPTASSKLNRGGASVADADAAGGPMDGEGFAACTLLGRPRKAELENEESGLVAVCGCREPPPLSKAGVIELHGMCGAGDVAESIGERPDAGAAGKRRDPAGRRERLSSLRDRGDGAAFVADGVNILGRRCSGATAPDTTAEATHWWRRSGDRGASNNSIFLLSY
jgi:hypothetical protein